MATSKRTHTKDHLSGQLFPVSLSPQRGTADPLTLAGRSGSVSCGGHCSYPLGVGVHKILCVLFNSGVSAPVPPKSSIKSLWPWKSDSLGTLESLCQIPRQRSLLWGSEPSQQEESFFSFIVPQFWGHLSRSNEIWFYCDCAPPTIFPTRWGFFFVFRHGVSSCGGFQCSPARGCRTASCDFGALTGRNEHTPFYSATLNQKQQIYSLIYYKTSLYQTLYFRGN